MDLPRLTPQNAKAVLTVACIALLAFYGASTVPSSNDRGSAVGDNAFADNMTLSTVLPILPGRSAQSPITQARVSSVTVSSTDALDTLFADAAFDLDEVRDTGATVPRLFLAALPRDYADPMPVDARKQRFIAIVLPMVLAVNEEIRAERTRIMYLQSLSVAGRNLSETNRQELLGLARKYRLDPETAPENFDAMLSRVDGVSVALTLAQAVEESGWGRSRFARDGNALFGQRTWTRGNGIVPTARGIDRTFEVQAFANLYESVRRYALNINTHRAYRNMRAARRDMRRNGAPLDGAILAGGLLAYSERGAAYVAQIRNLIQVNNFQELEPAALGRTAGGGRRI